MLVDSEGTLGLTLEAKLHLVPLPKAREVTAVQFDTILETSPYSRTRAVSTGTRGQAHSGHHAWQGQV
ncbi:hypothetical protein C2W62_32720 [Candidatus Entotheonella serta]|nr:hypothetical protein C2W62_32720 [Candidatus Entotheonella serta]